MQHLVSSVHVERTMTSQKTKTMQAVATKGLLDGPRPRRRLTGCVALGALGRSVCERTPLTRDGVHLPLLIWKAWAAERLAFLNGRLSPEEDVQNSRSTSLFNLVVTRECHPKAVKAESALNTNNHIPPIRWPETKGLPKAVTCP